MRGFFMVKMKDVAQRAGVSIATVSNVITGKRTVSPEVQKAVLQAIEENGLSFEHMPTGIDTICTVIPAANLEGKMDDKNLFCTINIEALVILPSIPSSPI